MTAQYEEGKAAALAGEPTTHCPYPGHTSNRADICPRCQWIDGWSRANSLMRKAAPDLLAALRALAAYFPTLLPSAGLPNKDIEAARAAIAKATGQEG